MVRYPHPDSPVLLPLPPPRHVRLTSHFFVCVEADSSRLVHLQYQHRPTLQLLGQHMLSAIPSQSPRYREMKESRADIA